jgi:hypothetical protein
VLAFVEPGDIILRQLDAAVQGHDVPDVELDAFGLNAPGNAFELLLVLGVDVRPEHCAAGLAEELPVPVGSVSVFELDDADRVGDFGGQQAAMLEADLRGSAFQMHKGPAASLKAVAF